MNLKRKFTIVILSQLATLGVAQAIQLQNPGFEDNPPTTYINGNNIGHSIAPWVLGTGDASNVVQQDGDSSFTNYSTNGPHTDASNNGAGQPSGTLQHYLDIANGSNDFYQSFESDCTGDIEIGGYFSTRNNGAGTAQVSVREGVGTGGNLVGQSLAVNLPAGNSQTDPWVPISTTVPVQNGTTYSLVISMDNNMNFDEAFIIQTSCSSTPPVVQPVPTLSQWSLILLSLLLAGISFFSSRKKKNY